MIRPVEGLLETSAVIWLSEIADPEQLPKAPRISAVTLAEISLGPLMTDDESERAIRLGHVQHAEQNFEPQRAVLPGSAGYRSAVEPSSESSVFSLETRNAQPRRSPTRPPSMRRSRAGARRQPFERFNVRMSATTVTITTNTLVSDGIDGWRLVLASTAIRSR